MALKLIDQFGLYNTIFTNADDETFGYADTTHWYQAYDQLVCIVTAKTSPTEDSDQLAMLKNLLLHNFAEKYRAWLLCALVPWARAPSAKPEKAGGKTPPSPACLAAREGIKAENKILKMVEDAVVNLQDIIDKKNEGAEVLQPTELLQKRKHAMLDTENRVRQGIAIRLWGTNWRSSVMYALLVEVSETGESGECTICVDRRHHY